MKKLNIFKAFCVTFLSIFTLCFAISVPANAEAVSSAGQIPAGYGYTHGRIPVVHTSGAPEIHDQNLMRYDRNSKLSKNGFNGYQKYGYGVASDENNANNNPQPQEQSK